MLQRSGATGVLLAALLLGMPQMLPSQTLAAVDSLRAGTASRLGVTFPDRAATPQVMRGR
jgi:hypothetical protein